MIYLGFPLLSNERLSSQCSNHYIKIIINTFKKKTLSRIKQMGWLPTEANIVIYQVCNGFPILIARIHLLNLVQRKVSITPDLPASLDKKIGLENFQGCGSAFPSWCALLRELCWPIRKQSNNTGGTLTFLISANSFSSKQKESGRSLVDLSYHSS